MKWNDVQESLPNDDDTVLVYNYFEGCLYILAYYDEESNEFYSIHSLNSFPISITHWLTLPPYPEEYESSKKA